MAAKKSKTTVNHKRLIESLQRKFHRTKARLEDADFDEEEDPASSNVDPASEPQEPGEEEEEKDKQEEEEEAEAVRKRKTGEDDDEDTSRPTKKGRRGKHSK